MHNDGSKIWSVFTYVKVTTGLILSLFTLKTQKLSAQSTIDYSVHANVIYHLTKYMEWPPTAANEDFIIGVIGETPLFEELQQATMNKTVGNRKIIIKHFSCRQEYYKCSIIFISNDANSCLERIILATRSMPVLIITEHEGFCLKGSCINLVIVDDKLKLEINKKNILNRNIKVATDLLSLATIVE